MEKILKNGIVVLTLSSLIFSPFLNLIPKANAQTYNTAGAYDTNARGVTGYISSLAPALTQLPLCKGKLQAGLKNLFKKPSMSGAGADSDIDNNPPDDEGTGSAGGAGGSTNDGGEGLMTDDSEVAGGDEELTLGENLNGDTYIADSEANSVATYDKIANSKLDTLTKDGKITKEKVSSLESNDTCLKSIGRMVIKMLLQKITISTVAWIQNGFDGNPAFIENPGVFFGDIAKTEILQFGIEINDPILFPYGRNFILNKAMSYNSTFQENAQYSLDKLIKDTTPEYSAQGFNEDFSQGGWSAWTKMTSVPGNNALGFQIIAGKELDNRISSTIGQIQEELKQAEGYLGDKRCVEPVGVTKAEHQAALALNKHVYINPIPGGDTGSTGGQSGSYTASGAYGTTGEYHDSGGDYYIEGACRRWEYVTPGQMIATAATKLVNYPDNNLLKAEDLNDAVASIIDALLARFSSDLMQKGFAKLSNDGADGTLIINSDEYGSNYIDTQVETDFSSSSMTNWLRKNNNFNIRYDLTQAFIDTQRTYADKLKEYNIELEKLIRNVYQLDYCIPGPAPDWKQRAYENLTNVSKSIPNTAGGQVDVIKGLFTMLKGITIGVSFIVKADFNIGYISEGVLTMLGQGLPEEIMTRYFYTTILINHTGMRAAPSSQIGSRGDVVNIMSEIIEGYDKAIKKTFNRDVMPDVTGLAASEYRKVKGYIQIRENNLNEIAIVNSVVSRLNALREEYGQLTQTQIEELGPSSPVIQKFARISANLVDGDDIADIVRLIGQTKDTTEYIFKDLLSGENGCECQVAANTTLEADTDRMSYPKNLFVPLPGRNYAITGVQCINDEDDDTFIDIVPYESNDCLAPLQGPGGDGDNPGGGGEGSPLPSGCQEANEEQNPYDPNEDGIDIECPEGEVSIPNSDGVGVCTDIDSLGNEIDGDVTDITAAIQKAEDEAEEADLDGKIKQMIQQFKNSSLARCEVNFETVVGTEYDEFKAKEDAYKNNNKGFLTFGYYGQLENYNPYGLELRAFPGEAKENQKVKIPYGVLNQNQQCALVKFGPTVQNGILRSLKSQFKECKKSDVEVGECYKAVWVNAAVAMYRACEADIDVEVMCKELRAGNFTGNGPPTGALYDSVRRFEKIMGLF
ncbi:MAG: hypothetical protein QG583_64 [Patescibacteria group bacterium]|nr:hypothetical protein [Patescibacteria group bacterium]